VQRLNAIATGAVTPDVTLLLDVPVDIGIERARAAHLGGKASDVIGTETLAFHQRVRDGFLALAIAEPGRITTLDASHALSAVLEAAWGAIGPQIGTSR
jgi:dTMP kinase